ncbi:hypothetical protein HY413_02925 [Candidatus Kaiserbacteria bacterium]|nr:hypothetical protein [Candidatus Kaiserbacteria bacterium]
MTTGIRFLFGVIIFALAAVTFIAIRADAATTTPYMIGFYCDPATQSYTEDGFYTFASDAVCTFDGTNVPRDAGVRFGALFRGTVGSSTLVTGHSLGTANSSVELNNMPADPIQDESYFTAIWQDRNFWFTNDTTDFVNSFTRGTPAPHDNYGFLNWKWGTPPATSTPPCIADCFSNVAFIPGIQATELYEESNRVWLPGVFNYDASRLAMNVAGESRNSISVGDPILKAYIFYEIYNELFGSFDDLKSMNTIVDWKALPYDWRYDVNDVVTRDQPLKNGTLLNLANEIRALAATSKTGKVTIIAHSNGGLVAKALIDSLGSDAEIVDRLVMVGTPQLGTPTAIPAMLHGSDQSLPLKFLPIAMTKATARELSENMPGAYGLLPLAGYFGSVLDPVVEFDNSSSTSAFRAMYGNMIDTPSELQSFLLGGDGRAKPATDDTFAPTILNSTLLTRAQATRNALEAWTPPAGIEVDQIVGWGLDTVRGTRYRERPCPAGAGCTTFLDIEPLLTVEGDMTVVSPSAAAMATTTYYFDMHAANTASSTSWVHANMLAAEPVQNLLKEIITQSPRSAPFITTTKPVADASRRLRVSVHSPVTLGVRDAEGRFTGIISNPDPASDIPVVVQEIPNSYYFEFGEGKYTGFDVGTEHTLVFKGADDGVFTLDIAEVGNGTTTTVTYSNIAVSTTTVAQMRIQDLGNKSALEIDEDGDGVIDETIDPDTKGQTIHRQLEDFRVTVTKFDLQKSIKKHLIARSFAVEKAIQKNKKNSIVRAKKILTQMEKYIQKRTDKKRGIKSADANMLINMLRAIRGQL